jgi:hypothetical protein
VNAFQFVLPGAALREFRSTNSAVAEAL